MGRTILVFLFSLLVVFMALEHARVRDEVDRVTREADELRDVADSLSLEIDSLHELSWENIEYFMDVYGVQHKDVVLRQVMIETGNLSSKICLENNNLFGMKLPRVRETVALGSKRGHAYYASWIDSVRDYKLWQDAMYRGGDYYGFLADVGYAEASGYVRALRSL